jgi:hypothetical membrane protein
MSGIGSASIWRQAAGAVAAAIFWPALVVFAAARPGYSHLTNAISHLGAVGTPYAPAWNAIGFVVPGLLLATCGAELAIAIDRRRGVVWWLLVLSGLAFAGTGVCPAVVEGGRPLMSSPLTIGHVVALLLSALAWLVAAAVVTVRMWRRPAWRTVRPIAIGASVLGVILFLANPFKDAIPALHHRPGLAQRIAFAGYFAWYLGMGLCLLASRRGARARRRVDDEQRRR